MNTTKLITLSAMTFALILGLPLLVGKIQLNNTVKVCQNLTERTDGDIENVLHTFGFDDSYIAERARIHSIPMRLGRIDPNAWKDDAYVYRDYLETEKKKFELASGTFAVPSRR